MASEVVSLADAVTNVEASFYFTLNYCMHNFIVATLYFIKVFDLWIDFRISISDVVKVILIPALHKSTKQ